MGVTVLPAPGAGQREAFFDHFVSCVSDDAKSPSAKPNRAALYKKKTAEAPQGRIFRQIG